MTSRHNDSNNDITIQEMSRPDGTRGESNYYVGYTTGLPDSVFIEGIRARLEREAEAEMDPHEPKVYTKKIARQIKYRRLREESLARDLPPRLPCRPFYLNGQLTAYEERTYDWSVQYHQGRLEQLPTPENNLDNCHTCTNHRNCNKDLCNARRLTCYYCESDKGPLRVRAKRAALERGRQRAN